MVHRNDADALLDQVIEHLRRQPIPDFPDPEIAVPRDARRHVTPVRFLSKLRRMAMNRRVQLSVGAIVGLAAVLGFVLLWGGSTAQQASAMEKMAESIRKAKSYQATMTMEAKRLTPGTPPATRKSVSTIYWLAPGASHLDTRGQVPSFEDTVELDTTQICFAEKAILIDIDHKAKHFKKDVTSFKTGLDLVGMLGTFSGQADRELGTREIHGKKARGFEIRMKKIFTWTTESAKEKEMLEVWLDPESNLPVLVQFGPFTYSKPKATVISSARIEDFRWNIDLDAKLFDSNPPKGYTDQTSHRYAGVVRVYTEGLKAYGELTGSRDYPPEGTVPEADAVYKSLLEAAGFKYYRVTNDIPPELRSNKEFSKIYKLWSDLYQMGEHLALNPDAAYYGKTVKPGDKEKILLRWKLDDGRYEVIFGDLQAETVTAEQLRALQGK